MKLLGAVFMSWAMLAPLGVKAQTVLMMAEEPGCYWCEKWDEEISAIYPKTAEGRTAPLRRYLISAPPEDVTFSRPVVFTPTFILVDNGQEVARIEGYPGEDFFWGLLGQMIDALPDPRSTTG